MKTLNTLTKTVLACTLLAPLAVSASILPVGGNYSVAHEANHIKVTVNDFKLRLAPDKYRIEADGDYLDIRQDKGRNGLYIRALPGEVRRDNHLGEIHRSKGEVNVEVASGGKLYDFHYSDIELDSELVSQHLNKEIKPVVHYMDDVLIAVQSTKNIPVMINEAPIINDSGFTGKDGVLHDLTRNYYTTKNKVMMLKRISADSFSTVYKRLKSIDIPKMTVNDLYGYVDIAQVHEDYIKMSFTVQSRTGEAFLLGNPLEDANFKSECRAYAKDSDFISERTDKGVSLSLYLRKDLYEACMIGKTLLGSVQVFDENLNSMRVRY